MRARAECRCFMSRFSSGQKKTLLVLAIVVSVVGGGAATLFYPSASNQGYAPEQPIPFSHKRHAGENKMACAYCHVGIEKSRHATVPAVNVCMNCHSVVKTDSPHIQKIQKAFREGTPIEWVRVHELPDFAYFPHKRHVAKGVSCETCHGDVRKMDKVYQYAPMNMGWCMDCRRGVTTPRNVLAEIAKERPEVLDASLNHKPVASVQCAACHH